MYGFLELGWYLVIDRVRDRISLVTLGIDS